MSNLYSCDASSARVDIPEAASGKDGVTYYQIRVRVGPKPVEWSVDRRYKDFSRLHESLLSGGAGVDKDSLPQKRLLGNRDPAFIMKRRKELETYLQAVFKFLMRKVPECLSDFLCLDRYDVHFVLRRISAQHYDRVARSSSEEEAPAPATTNQEGDSRDGGASPVKRTETGEDALEVAEEAAGEAGQDGAAAGGVGEHEEDWTPLELHAISSRLRSSVPAPEEEEEEGNKRHDFALTADRACQLSSLAVRGSEGEIGTSNIVPNRLKFDFVAFKSLSQLTLDGVPCREILTSLGPVRGTLRRLRARRCSLRSVADMLLCDAGGAEAMARLGRSDDTETPSDEDEVKGNTWERLERLDLNDNEITEIDRSARLLAPRLNVLSLAGNSITEIKNVAGLADLNTLDLSRNAVEEAEGLNARLGQLSRLDLAENLLRTLSGFAKLYSLQHLNLAANRIADLKSVEPVSRLPCLESLNLQGNKVTTVVDYRIKVFELFGKRCSEICLDNETPSQPEVDKVSVLMALRVAREGMAPTTLFGNLPRRVTQE